MKSGSAVPAQAGIYHAPSDRAAGLTSGLRRDDALWYKDAIIYQLHVKAFFDSNNDGMGDFPGLTSKLDYIRALGVNTLWLLPFYISPLRDDGYDIADYRNINPAYGTMEDFRQFVQEAHARDIRVITELVVNHTSDQHPWFQRARHAPPGSNERNFYVWSDTDQHYLGTRIIFSDTEKSNWAWDSVAKQYYWHRFFSHQPDLNFDHPEVLQEIIEVMYYWLDMGVDGLRLDAVPYLCERDGTNNENLPETHDIIKKIRAALDARYSDRLLLAEANQWPEDVLAYFGDFDKGGDECHMAFHFPLMPRIYMAVAQEDRHPVTDIMAQTPDIPENCQWATFLRNHDELTLEMVSDRERDYLWNFYAADKRARINFGIRRRLAPLMDNDRRKIELLNALLMSMPGTPIIYYGDEIGMGDNIFLGDRDGVRTPMQWSPDRNGGFSRVDPPQLYLPALMDPIYGFQSLNVEAQLRVHNSLFNWMRGLIAAVESCKAFGRGAIRFLRPANRKVLAYLREYNGEIILCVVNLSRSSQPVELDLREFNGRVPMEMLGQSDFPHISELPYFLTLLPYGFFWFRLNEAKALAEKTLATTEELMTLVVPKGWESLFTGKTRQMLERQILPSFLKRQRWFKTHTGESEMSVVQHFPLDDGHQLLLLSARQGEAEEYYVIACGIAWESMQDDPMQRLQAQTLSRIRKTNQVGVLYEALQSEDGVRALLTLGQEVEAGGLRLRVGGNMPAIGADMAIKPSDAEQSNSSASIGDQFMFKVIRQPQPGINPEEEISHFLSAQSPFERTPRLYGSFHIAGLGEAELCIGLLQQAVRNQGDGWKVTLDYLARQLSEVPVPDAPETPGEHDYYAILAERLGQRTAELHAALSVKTGNPDFDPETLCEEDRTRWLQAISKQWEQVLQRVKQTLPRLSDYGRQTAESLLARQAEMDTYLPSLLPSRMTLAKIRVHGDYHLGQVLVSENDFTVIDFEGEPARPLAERRRKTSPYKDVAGMLRSFDYAAATALKQATPAKEEEEANARLMLAQWREEASQAFLRGYDNNGYGSAHKEERDGLLAYFLVEKAVYEIAYEAQHRPEWMEIPIAGLLGFLERRNTP